MTASFVMRDGVRETSVQNEPLLGTGYFPGIEARGDTRENTDFMPVSPATLPDQISITHSENEQRSLSSTLLRPISSAGGVTSYSQENLDHQNNYSEEKRPKAAASSQLWEPGSYKFLPWIGLLSLAGAFICAAAAFVVLWLSNDKAANWMVEPSVLIAVITPVANILLGVALARGTTISWWAAAVKGGCKIGNLSRRYDFANGFLDSLLAGRHTEWTAMAKLLAGLVVIDGPLLQRASTIVPQNITQNVTLPIKIATTRESFVLAGFLSSFTDGFGDPFLLTSPMVKVMQDYGKRAPIVMNISGCADACSATIEAAGVLATCHTSSDYVSVLYNNGGGNDTSLFSSGFNVMNYHTHSQFNWTTTYSNTTNGPPQYFNSEFEGDAEPTPGDCFGTAVTTNCQIEHAILRYPVIVQNSTVTLQSSSLPLEIVSTESVGELSDPDPGSERVFDGLGLALKNLYTASAISQTMGKYGYRLNMTGSLAMNYLVNGSGAADQSCNYQFSDPTQDVLSSLNEIMFRIALAAVGNGTTIPTVNVIAQQISIQNTYHSHFGYLAAALAVMVIGILSVLPTFWGWWTLGRPVTMNPIETAKAFNAPLFAGPEFSNATKKQLLQEFGKIEVQYGEATPDAGNGLIGSSSWENQPRLEISRAGSVVTPRPGTAFG